MNLAFATRKGGAGKSTTCAAVASYLASQGDKVLAFDLDDNINDEEGTLTDWYGLTELPTLKVLQVPLNKFAEVYRAEAKGYDHILIDLPGQRDDKGLISALGRAHLVIIPAVISRPDLKSALKARSDVAEVSELTGRDIPYRVLWNQITTPSPTKLERHILEQARAAGLAEFKTIPWKRTAYSEMLANGVAPHDRDDKAKDEVERLLTEIAEILAHANQVPEAAE